MYVYPLRSLQKNLLYNSPPPKKKCTLYMKRKKKISEKRGLKALQI